MSTLKQALLHRLTQERATVFYGIAFLPDEELVRRPAFGEWSAKDVLGHLAAWDGEYTRAIEQFRRGERPSLWDIGDCDAWNAEQARRRWDMPLEHIEEELISTRRRLLDLLTGLPDDSFYVCGPPPLHHRAFLPHVLNALADHDREHWADLIAFKEAWIARQQVTV